MHDVPIIEASPEFARCMQAAAVHMEWMASAHCAEIFWQKANLEPPFLEHLSFRLENQLFFIRVVDVERRVEGPGGVPGLMSIAEGCQGHPCFLPLRHRSTGWEPVRPGWGLVHALTGSRVDPVALIADERVAMTDWELHDFAVKVVRHRLEKEGREIMSSQGNPRVNPSLWFVGDEGPEWVVVRVARYPQRDAAPPDNWSRIEASCSRHGGRGNFASVAVISREQRENETSVPLWRGEGMGLKFEGLVPGDRLVRTEASQRSTESDPARKKSDLKKLRVSSSP